MKQSILTDEQIGYTVRQVLATAVAGGMRQSWFVDTVSDDADMLMQEVFPLVPKSKKHVIEEALTQWRIDFAYLKDLPDKIEGE